VVNQPDKWAVS